jgi:AraC-like DNA-binding protein
MAVHEITPSPDLAEYVDAYWWSDRSSVGSMCILPDGCADVVFDPKGAFVVGAMTRPLRIDAAESVGAFGIRFRPGRAALALRTPLTLLTDARVPLADVTKHFPTIDHQRIESVEEALRSMLSDSKADPRVDAAVEAIIRSSGRASIEKIAGAAGVSRQHLARAFAYHVGVSPKTFARVMRFRRALALSRAGTEGWADLAAELGYFDQSHMIAEFREFAGDTPVPFFLSLAD